MSNTLNKMRGLVIKYLFVAFVAVASTNILSAQMNTDSLRAILENEKNDSITISSRLIQMQEISTADMNASLAIGNWAADAALKSKHHRLHVKALLAIAGLYHRANDFPEAIEYYTQTQEAADKYGETELALETLNNLGNVYYLNNQDDKAEQIFKLTVAECERLGITVGIAAGYGSLASIYFSTAQKDPARRQKGIDYMHMSIRASESIKDTTQLVPSFSSLAKMYSGIGQSDSALYYIEKAGWLLANKKNYEEPYLYHYYHKGTVLLKKGEPYAAIKSFLQGLAYTKRFNSPLWESSHYDGLSKAYKAIGDHKKALEYAERYYSIEDSIINAKNFAKAADLQNKYERQKKDKEIVRLGKEKEIAAERRKQLNTWLLVALAGLGILSFLLFLLLRNIKARNKAYALLEKQNSEIREQAIQLSRQSRIIAKFQSQMNPHFTFNALHNIYGLVATNENDKAEQQIQSLAGLMRQTLTNSVKEEITLEEEVSYLRKYIEFEKAATPSPFNFRVDVGAGLEDALIPPMMIQPFVENAVKHAGLDKVTDPFVKVMIEKENDLMKLIIQDNGKGIDTRAGNLNKLSHSVSIIRSRIEMLLQAAGKMIPEYFTIRAASDPQKGTVVEFYLPLNYAH